MRNFSNNCLTNNERITPKWHGRVFDRGSESMKMLQYRRIYVFEEGHIENVLAASHCQNMRFIANKSAIAHTHSVHRLATSHQPQNCPRRSIISHNCISDTNIGGTCDSPIEHKNASIARVTTC